MPKHKFVIFTKVLIPSVKNVVVVPNGVYCHPPPLPLVHVPLQRRYTLDLLGALNPRLLFLIILCLDLNTLLAMPLNNILRFDPQTSALTNKNVMEGVGLL